MTEFAQIDHYVFLRAARIDAFHVQMHNTQDMTECYYSIKFRDSFSPVYLNCDDSLPVKFQSEDEAVDYLKRYIDNGFRLLD